MFNNEHLLSIVQETLEDESHWVKRTNDEAFVGVCQGWRDGKEKYLQHVKKFDTVIQAGGYVGVYPMMLAKVFKTVYTFEPDFLNFYCLVNNADRENIIKFQAALSDTHDLIDVVRPCDTNPGMNFVKSDGIIPTLRIDDLNLNSCDLIQLDVEGYEHKILSGGLRTIAHFRPVIIVEDCNEKILQLLHGYDYEVVNKVHRDTILVANKKDD